MPTKEKILYFLSDRKEEFFQEFQLVKLGLFGSFATNEYTDESDIDLIVEFEPNTDQLFDKKAKIRSLVKSQFNRDVDLCREKYIKPYFKSQILESAIYV